MDLEDMKAKEDAIKLLKKDIETFVVIVRLKDGNKRALFAGSNQEKLIDWIKEDVRFNDTIKV